MHRFSVEAGQETLHFFPISAPKIVLEIGKVATASNPCNIRYLFLSTTETTESRYIVALFWDTKAAPSIHGTGKSCCLPLPPWHNFLTESGFFRINQLVLIITRTSPPIIAIISRASAPIVTIIYWASPIIHYSITAIIPRITPMPIVIWTVVPSVPWAR